MGTKVDHSQTLNNKSTRLTSSITFFRGCRKAIMPTHFGTVEQLIQELQSPSSELIQYTTQRPNKATSPLLYKDWKEGTLNGGFTGCPAFIPGTFEKRADKACKQYLSLLVFDVDAIQEHENLTSYINRCKGNEYIFAAFPSPSEKGLRVLIWADSTLMTLKKLYLHGANWLSKLLEIPTDKQISGRLKAEGKTSKEIKAELDQKPHIDTSTSNPGRIWFYCAVPKEYIYINLESKVFKTVDTNQPIIKTENSTPTQYKSLPDFTMSIEDLKVKVCLDKVSRQDLPSGRNHFVYALACELCRHGVHEATALHECSSYEEASFNLAEIKKTVNSAYKRKQVEFTDNQVLKYARAIGLAGSSKTTTPLPESSVKEEIEQEKSDDNSEIRRFEKQLSKYWDFRFNLISRMPEYKVKNDEEFEKISDYELNSIVRELRLKGVPKVSRSKVAETIESSFAPPVNPIEAYFKDLVYDGKDHIGALCETVDTIASKEMFQRYFSKWLIGAVANVFVKNRCANHICFILVSGAQGKYKSSWIRLLCPPKLMDYYFEGNLDPENKDDLFATAANFIYNLDDYFAAVTKKKINELKSFITKDTVNARRAYSRYPDELPKICSFIASSNEQTFLHDPTGNRRFVPFEVNEILIKKAENIDMNQVWAQAYNEYEKGTPYWLTPEELKELSEHNSQYEVQSAEYEQLTTYFQVPKSRKDAEVTLKISQILSELKLNSGLRLSQKKLGEALRMAGFERFQRRIAGARPWVYALDRKDEADQAAESDGSAKEDDK